MHFGPGCTFYHPPHLRERGSPILQWGNEQPAAMSIDGETLALTLETPLPHAARIGERASFRALGRGAAVHGRLKSLRVCAHDDTSCAVTEFQGALEVDAGSRKATLQVWGSCASR